MFKDAEETKDFGKIQWKKHKYIHESIWGRILPPKYLNKHVVLNLNSIKTLWTRHVYQIENLDK